MSPHPRLMKLWDESWIFESDDIGIRNRFANNSSYYVYALCRTSGEPFYIGKGKGYRALAHAGEARQGKRLFENNPHKNNVIRKISRSGERVIYKIAREFTDEQESLDFEHLLIEHYKRACDGGCLTNLNPGSGSARGPAPLSMRRHVATLSGTPADNPDRAILNEYLQSIGGVESVPIKPLTQLNIQHSLPHSQPRKPSLRCAYALIATAAANNLTLCDGIGIPRRFFYKDIEGILENGVCKDILKAGMARLKAANHPANEVFLLDGSQVDVLIYIFGKNKLATLGLVD